MASNPERTARNLILLQGQAPNARVDVLVLKLLGTEEKVLKLRAECEYETSLQQHQTGFVQFCQGLKTHFQDTHFSQREAFAKLQQQLSSTPHLEELVKDTGLLISLAALPEALQQRWTLRMQHWDSLAQISLKHPDPQYETIDVQKAFAHNRASFIFPIHYNSETAKKTGQLLDLLLDNNADPIVQSDPRLYLMGTPKAAALMTQFNRLLAAQVSYFLAHGIAASFLDCQMVIAEACRGFLYTTRLAELIGAAHAPQYDTAFEFFSCAMPGFANINAQGWCFTATELSRACKEAPSTVSSIWPYKELQQPWRSVTRDSMISLRAENGLVLADRIPTYHLMHPAWNGIRQVALQSKFYQEHSEQELLNLVAANSEGTRSTDIVFEEQRQFYRPALEEDWP